MPREKVNLIVRISDQIMMAQFLCLHYLFGNVYLTIKFSQSKVQHYNRYAYGHKIIAFLIFRHQCLTHAVNRLL